MKHFHIRFLRPALMLCLAFVVCVSGSTGVAAKKIKKKQKKNVAVGVAEISAQDVFLGNNMTIYSTMMYTNYELKLLTCIIQTEAGNQPYKGMVGVGNVVLNRVDSPNYASTIKGVIYQKSQFSPVDNGSMAKALRNYSKMSAQTKRCQKAARAALAGENYVGDRTGFCTPEAYEKICYQYAQPDSVLKIGGHIFWKSKSAE